MKTLKFALIAALIACAMVSLAEADGIKAKPKKIVYCTFDKAIHTPWLLIAMYQQLEPKFISKEQPSYSLDVVLGGTIYRINGTRDQWVAFFAGKYKVLIERKATVFNSN